MAHPYPPVAGYSIRDWEIRHLRQMEVLDKYNIRVQFLYLRRYVNIIQKLLRCAKNVIGSSSVTEFIIRVTPTV